MTNQAPPAAETTWLEQIIYIEKKDSDAGSILLISLANSRRYAIPLTDEVRMAIYKLTSPFTIASEMPPNGSGTRLPGQ